jgi:hypothetical protein
MPKPKGAPLMLSLYRRGIITGHEAANKIIHLAAVENDTAELINSLPSDLLAGVRQRVAEAPTTEQGWSGLISIYGGSFTSDYDTVASLALSEASYRAGIECLRCYFEQAASNASP